MLTRTPTCAEGTYTPSRKRGEVVPANIFLVILAAKLKNGCVSVLSVHARTVLIGNHSACVCAARPSHFFSKKVDAYALPSSQASLRAEEEEGLFRLKSMAVETTINLMGETGVMGQTAGIMIETYMKN